MGAVIIPWKIRVVPLKVFSFRKDIIPKNAFETTLERKDKIQK